MEADVLRAIAKISGRQSRDCYFDLCCLVEAALPYMPGKFSLERLYPAAQKTAGKNRDALTKSLSRVAEDIWYHGDREELRWIFHRIPRDKPSPKELVQGLALFVWTRRQSGPVRYQLLRSSYPQKFGFSGESENPKVSLVVLPYSSDRAEVERIVLRLNQEQVSVQEVREYFLGGGEFP